MKVYPATKNTTSIIKFILQLEFSQIQELISAYSEMLLFFTKYSFFFESSITDYQPLKSEYVPIDSKLSTSDPARDGGNWYAYCNNSPLTFTDPLGLYPYNNLNEAMEDYYTNFATETDIKQMQFFGLINQASMGNKSAQNTLNYAFYEASKEMLQEF